MPLNVVGPTDDTAYHPIFLSILEDIPGGIVLNTDRIPSATKEIKKGALLHAIATAASLGEYRLCKTAKLYVNIDTSAVVTIIVYTAHELKVGESIGAEGNHSGATIAAITKGAVTDRIVFTAGGGGLNCGSIASARILVEKQLGAGVTLLKYSAEAILKQTVKVRDSDLTTLYNVACAAVVRGTVNESILPYYVTSYDKTALTDRIRWA